MRHARITAVLGALTELELRRVDPDHDQAERGVPAIPRLDIGQGSNLVEIAVDDAPRVQCRERSENSEFDRQRVGDAERAFPQALG